jgi:trans-aconitate methyltransferase
MKKYWEHEDRLINYFTLHLMFVALLHRDKLFSQEFAQVPIISDEPMHLLLHEIAKGSNYSDDLMTKARKASFIQKLTYKFPAEMLDNKESLVSVLSKQT